MSPGRSARPAPICAASWPSSGTQMPELTLALQRGGLPVRAAHQHHVAVEAWQGRGVDVRDVGVELRARRPARPPECSSWTRSGALVGAAQPGEDVLAGRGGAASARWGSSRAERTRVPPRTPGRVPVRGRPAPGRVRPVTTPVRTATGRVVPSSWHDGRARGSGRCRAHARIAVRGPCYPGTAGRRPCARRVARWRGRAVVGTGVSPGSAGGVVDGAVVVNGSGVAAAP